MVAVSADRRIAGFCKTGRKALVYYHLLFLGNTESLIIMITEYKCKRNVSFGNRCYDITDCFGNLFVAITRGKTKTVAFYLVTRKHYKVGVLAIKRFTDKFHSVF